MHSREPGQWKMGETDCSHSSGSPGNVLPGYTESLACV